MIAAIDIAILFINLIIIFLFFQKKEFKYINILISVNMVRLLATYIFTSNTYHYDHFFSLFFLFTINFLDKEKILNSFFKLTKYLQFLIIFFLFVFTFKENFLIIHPGIAGWTYEGEMNYYMNDNSYLVEESDENIDIKNQIEEHFSNYEIVGFEEGYLDINSITIAKTNLGNFIINEGDYHIVFPFVIFDRMDYETRYNLQKQIIEKTLCDRINNKRFLVNRNFSYPDHSVYFKLNSVNGSCDNDLNLIELETYTIFSNIEGGKYDIKHVAKIEY